MTGNLLMILTWLSVVVVSPFVIWRRIRDEYNDEEVVKLLLLLVGLSIVGAKVFGILAWLAIGGWQQEVNWWTVGEMDIWGGVMAGLGGMWWYHLDRVRGLTGEVEDAFLEGYWWAWLILAIGGGVGKLINGDLYGLVGIIIWLLGLGCFYWVRGKYRQFGWYPSGKVGFMFWASIIFLGLGYMVWAFVSGNVLLGFGRFIFGSGTMIFGLIGGYRRSGRKTRKDFGWLPGIKF